MESKNKEYATVQIRKDIKEQVVEYCSRHGLKIGRFIEQVFLEKVSGSAVQK